MGLRVSKEDLLMPAEISDLNMVLRVYDYKTPNLEQRLT